MTKTNANATRFTVDFFNAVIIGTKASFNKASKGTGDAYEELTRLMAAHPNFKLEVKEQKHHIERAKRTYDGLNFKFMETYIATLTDAVQMKKEYVAVKALAKAEKISVYPITKKWFIEKFGEYDMEVDGMVFDMDKANEAITEFRLRTAETNASAGTAENSSLSFSVNTEDNRIGA